MSEPIEETPVVLEEADSVISNDSEKSEQDLSLQTPRDDDSTEQKTTPAEKKSTEKKEKVSKRAKQKMGAPKQRSKKYQEAISKVDSQTKYSLLEAIELTQTTSYTKFPGSLEAHINTSQKGLRGLVSMPYSSGKKLTILAFGPSGDLGVNDDVKIGDEDTIKEILKGKLGFDVVVSTPEWMSKLAPAAKILGPRGLMPNPKSGTVTDNLKKAVEELQAGKVEYKTEPNGMVIHMLIGKVTQPKEEIQANIKSLYNILGRSRVKKITLTSTMGPGVKVDLSSI